jgi:potassium-transporting ATPase KdpC subunit
MHTPSSALIARGAWRPAIVMAAIALLGFGFLYSAAMASLCGLIFPQQSTGSLLMRDGRPVASKWVAQPFADDRYFQSRPSAASYDPMAAAGSNQALTNPDLIKTINDQIDAVAKREGITRAQVPADLATRSGSGLDPHVSPSAAQVQIARVAKARGMSIESVTALVERAIEPRQFGLLGQPRVNVVELNLALDAQR